MIGNLGLAALHPESLQIASVLLGEMGTTGSLEPDPMYYASTFSQANLCFLVSIPKGK